MPETPFEVTLQLRANSDRERHAPWPIFWRRGDLPHSVRGEDFWLKRYCLSRRPQLRKADRPSASNETGLRQTRSVEEGSSAAMRGATVSRWQFYCYGLDGLGAPQLGVEYRLTLSCTPLAAPETDGQATMTTADEVYWQVMSAFHASIRNIDAPHPIVLTVMVPTEVFTRSFNAFESSTLLTANTKFIIDTHESVQVIDTLGPIGNWFESMLTSIPVDMVPSRWSVCVVQQPILVSPSTITLLPCLCTDIAKFLAAKASGMLLAITPSENLNIKLTSCGCIHTRVLQERHNPHTPAIPRQLTTSSPPLLLHHDRHTLPHALLSCI
jgi:hypothetical protein